VKTFKARIKQSRWRRPWRTGGDRVRL